MNGMKVCLACSAGGHLTELLQVEEAYKALPHYYVTDARIDSREFAGHEKTYFVECPRRNPFKSLVNLVQSLNVLLREKPTTILSTGADTAFFTCLLGKLLGAKLVFIESFARIREPSLSGRLLYPLADHFFVQWPDLKAKLPRAVYAGSVF